MELWYTEKQTLNLGLSCKVKETLYHVKTEYQEMAVLDTIQFGRMLVLDGMVQTTIADEFVYHEMITHIPMHTHPCPRNVLVIGGGDGGAVREIIKYPQVEKVTLVEIDGQVIEAAKRFLPEISSALENTRVEVKTTDGIEYVRSLEDAFDVIIVDSTEPVGPAVGLFGSPFYEGAFRALKPDGIFVAQTESPFFNSDLIRTVFRRIKTVFPCAYLYLASVPTYPSGLWSFTLGSKRYNPLEPEGKYVPQDTRYYTSQIHRSSFSLPRFVQELLEDKTEAGIY
ncbi:MAG: polyamine aminopropyltransferase [Dethiobacter sp.]|nr:MAG: polyamine aminopropyltransferase [Dethiobacter sp.]